MDAVDGAVVACDGGDERRQAAEAAPVAVVEGGMEAQRGEAAAVDGADLEIVLGVGAVDGAARAPEAACGLDAVVCGGLAAGGDRRHGEEGAGFVEGGLERRRADAETDEVEQVAVLAGGGVGHLPGAPGGARRTNRDRPLAPRASPQVQ